MTFGRLEIYIFQRKKNVVLLQKMLSYEEETQILIRIYHLRC